MTAQPSAERIVTVKVPEGYDSIWDFLNDCGLESVSTPAAKMPSDERCKLRGFVGARLCGDDCERAGKCLRAEVEPLQYEFEKELAGLRAERDAALALVERLKTGLEKIERGSTSVLLTAELNDEPIARGVLMCIRDDAQSALTSTSSSSSKVSEDELTASAATRGRNAAIHSSDCAIHNGPALKPGPCDCGALTSTDKTSGAA